MCYTGRTGLSCQAALLVTLITLEPLVGPAGVRRRLWRLSGESGESGYWGGHSCIGSVLSSRHSPSWPSSRLVLPLFLASRTPPSRIPRNSPVAACHCPAEQARKATARGDTRQGSGAMLPSCLAASTLDPKALAPPRSSLALSARSPHNDLGESSQGVDPDTSHTDASNASAMASSMESA